MRVGLARAASLAGLRPAGEGRDLGEASGLARQNGAGLIIIGDTDEATPGVVRRLAATVLVVALVRRATRDELTGLLGAGVAGVSLRSATAEELSLVVRRATSGERAIAQALVPALVGWSGSGIPSAPPLTAVDAARADAARADAGADAAGADAPAGATELLPGALTAKERQVLTALAAGARNHQIAAQLFVSQATVKTHLGHIYSKLGVSSRHEALARAVALGLVH